MREYIRSMTPGRVRIRHDMLKNRATGEKVRSVLEARQGVFSAHINSRTGSLLLEYDSELLSSLHLLAFVEELRQILGLEFDGTQEKARQLSGSKLGRIVSRRLENRGMLFSLGVSLAGILAGSGTVHGFFGCMFLAFNALHLARFRKCL